MTASAEVAESFACFGSSCEVRVGGGRDGSAAEAAARARDRLLDWHERFTRFEPDSELSLLNADPRATVPVSPLMAGLVQSIRVAAERTAGLVDGTLLAEIETAGYLDDLGPGAPLSESLPLAPPRRPARARPGSPWRRVEAYPERGEVRRPPGLGLDSGGLVKGMLADVLAGALRSYRSFAVVCGGDMRIGGTEREVRVESPFDGRILQTFVLADAGVATSGIGKRSWLGRDGAPAHHLLDPATGQPAFTGVVQATAIAPTAFEAEWRAKAAVLSGPRGALAWLPHGGLVVLDDASSQVVSPPQGTLRRTDGSAQAPPPASPSSPTNPKEGAHAEEGRQDRSGARGARGHRRR